MMRAQFGQDIRRATGAQCARSLVFHSTSEARSSGLSKKEVSYDLLLLRQAQISTLGRGAHHEGQPTLEEVLYSTYKNTHPERFWSPSRGDPTSNT